MTARQVVYVWVAVNAASLLAVAIATKYGTESQRRFVTTLAIIT